MLLFAAAGIFLYGLLTAVPKSTKTVYSYSSTKNNIVEQLEGDTLSISAASSAQAPVASNIVRMVLVGDMMFQYPLDEMIINLGASPYDYVREYFKTFDVVVGSLETNIAPWTVGAPQAKPFRFRGPLEAIQRMKQAGFSVLTVANNHTMDYGPEAFLTQLDLIQQAGILTAGGGSTIHEAFAPRYVEVNGTKIAFIGVNNIESEFQDVRTNRAGTAFFDANLLSQSLNQANQNADIVVVFCHWGSEHVTEPTDFQKQWSRFLIDYGADLVVGSHPHIRQTSEHYNGKPIIYSLGNFVYTGMGWSEEAQYGSMLEVVIKDKQLLSTFIRTTKMTYHGYPDPLDF